MKTSAKSGPRLIIIELNEFNEELLKTVAKKLNLKNILRVFELNRTASQTDNFIEHQGMDPWVQWTSFHTGVPSAEHKINHMNQSQNLKHLQIWEELSSKNIKSMVWNVLSSKKGDSPNCLSYIPDIWNISEPAFPEHMNNLIHLPHYIAKNRLRFSFVKALLLFPKFVSTLLPFREWVELIRMSPLIFKSVIKNFRIDFWGFCFFEYFTARLFFYYWGRHKPQFGILFLNSLAHVEHYYWKHDDSFEIKATLQLIDRLLHLLWKEKDKGVEIIILNALSQKRDNIDTPYFYYRIIKPEFFLQKMKIIFLKIDPLMSHDIHICFSSELEMQTAIYSLDLMTIDGKKIFDNKITSTKSVYCRIDFSNHVSTSAEFEYRNVKYAFSLFFKPLILRTGGHDSKGTIYSSAVTFSDNNLIYELKNKIVKFFN